MFLASTENQAVDRIQMLKKQTEKVDTNVFFKDHKFENVGTQKNHDLYLQPLMITFVLCSHLI